MTAIVLGFWLYVLNAPLLAGAEYNAARRRQGQGPDVSDRDEPEGSAAQG